jgi:phosphoribosylformimino-5-aminoimidazole carboxamide ribotide isomerase
VEIIPAIDLRHGKVVRLNQGDFDRQTTFSDDPLAVARGFEATGAMRIHVVDLDGSLEGAPVQNEIYSEIAAELDIPIEVGGGFRTAEHVGLALEAGVGRIVLGTAAIANPNLVAEVIAAHGPERIVVGIDAKNGKVAVSGWTKTTDVDAIDLMNEMYGLGARRFVFTDISRDGTLTEPNFESTAAMVKRGHILGDALIIASGGIGETSHLKRLAEMGCDGAIVGSALYRGTIDLPSAIRELGA